MEDKMVYRWKKVNRLGFLSLLKIVGGVCWKIGWVLIFFKVGCFFLDLEVLVLLIGSLSCFKVGFLFLVFEWLFVVLWGVCWIGFFLRIFLRVGWCLDEDRFLFVFKGDVLGVCWWLNVVLC